jgi:hypothetical protein
MLNIALLCIIFASTLRKEPERLAAGELDIRRSDDAHAIVAGGPDGYVEICRLTDGKLVRRSTIAKRFAGYTRLDGGSKRSKRAGHRCAAR